MVGGDLNILGKEERNAPVCVHLHDVQPWWSRLIWSSEAVTLPQMSNEDFEVCREALYVLQPFDKQDHCQTEEMVLSQCLWRELDSMYIYKTTAG